MRTQEEEIIKSQILVVKCDFCDYTVKRRYLTTCSVCHKDLCHNHATCFYEGNGDYHTHAACPDHKEIVQKAFDEVLDYETSVPDLDTVLKRLMKE
jgi:hypothetical protein